MTRKAMTRKAKTQKAPKKVSEAVTPKYRLPECFHYPDSFTKDELEIYSNLSSLVYLIERSIQRDVIVKREQKSIDHYIISLYKLKTNNWDYFDQYMVQVWKYFEFNYGIDLLRQRHEKGLLSKRTFSFIYFAQISLDL